MSALQYGLTPKTKPLSPKRSAMVAALDIGTSKIACLIARLRPNAPPELVHGRSHSVEVLGFGHTLARGLMCAAERCHVEVGAMAASPYAAGLSVLADDEADLGAAVIDMGAGTTTIAVFSGGRFVHGAGFALGGQHVTLDLARGLNARVVDAERLKTLYGSGLSGG